MSRGVGIALAAALVCGGLAVWLSRPAAVAARMPRNAASKAAPFEGSSAGTLPLVRVRLRNTSATGTARTIRIDGPYRITELDHWRVLAQGPKLPPAEVMLAGESIQIGDNAFEPRRLAIEVVKDGTLWVGDRRYRGTLQLLADPEGRLTFVNVVPLEAYLASVLPSEMPGTFPEAAQQAQTIAARTYALYHLKSVSPGRVFDVDDTTSQRYGGMEYIDGRGRRLAVESAASRRIIEQTRGAVLLYQGRLFCTYYSSVCGGHSLSGPAVFNDAAPPLAGVPCDDCRDATNYRWERRMPVVAFIGNVDDHLAPAGKSLGTLASIAVAEQSLGAVSEVTLTGSGGTHRFTGAELKRIAGNDWPSAMLLSTEIAGDELILRGRGWGHGVGFCQHGARNQAKQHRTCSEILSYYFPGSRLATVH